MMKRIRDITLPIAICFGLLFNSYLCKLYFITPYLLFLMMFFTCSKIDVKDLKLNRMQFIMLLVQVIGGVTVYLLFRGYNETVAQGLMMVVFTPVAIASPVVGGMLGADVAMMTTYVLISNATAAVLAPVMLSAIAPAAGHITFMASFLHIMQRTVLLIVLPMILSVLLDRFTPRIHRTVQKYQPASFYLWALCMMILLGTTFNSIFNDRSTDALSEIIMASGALVLCLLLFSIGKRTGRRYGDAAAGRQMMGQKNTGIGVWLTISFLTPTAAVAPACYIVWQNLMNSLEIIRKDRKGPGKV